MKRIIFSDEQRAAMRLVEHLVNDGMLVLSPDRFNDGRMVLQQPHHARLHQPPPPPPMRAAASGSGLGTGSMLIAAVFLIGVVVGCKMAGGW